MNTRIDVDYVYVWICEHTHIMVIFPLVVDV